MAGHQRRRERRQPLPFFDMAYQGFASATQTKTPLPSATSSKKATNPASPNLSRRIWVCTASGWARFHCLRLRGREGTRGLPTQNPSPPSLLQPSRPWCSHSQPYSQRLRSEQAVAGRGERHGRPHHPDACVVERKLEEAGEQAQLEPHHGSDRHVCVYGVEFGGR